MTDDKLVRASLAAMRTVQTLNEQLAAIQKLGGTPNISIHETAPIEVNVLGQSHPVSITEREVGVSLQVTRPVVVECVEHRSVLE